MSSETFLPPNHTQEDWNKAMKHLCKCGHPFYQHAFTMHPNFIDPTVTVLRSSQCTFCSYDREKENVNCEEFDPK